MDDDGLMLNFATESPASSTPKRASKVTGGRWKDRRRAQLTLEGRQKKRAAYGANSIEVDPEKRQEREQKARLHRETDREQRPRKRRSEEDVESQASRKVRFQEKAGEFGGKNNSYVSSLFTSAPEIEKREYKEKTETQAPSNAPLADSTDFPGLGVEEHLAQHLTEHLKFQHPTKIQRSVIPRLLTRDRDLFVQAQTGSGKTLAFALPIFQKLQEIKDLNRSTGVFALILTPTRELANQIYSVLESLTRCCHRIVPGIVIGGEKKKGEKARLRKGVNILVATPGRLADHIENTEILDLSNIRYLVLDEGDRLMDLGFEETIAKILDRISKTSRIETTTRLYPQLPRKRINVLCSATIKGNAKKLGDISLDDAELVNVQSVSDVPMEDEEYSAPDQLVQQVLVVPAKLRLVTLYATLKNIVSSSAAGSRTVVFFSCSDSVNYHFTTLTRKGKKIVSKKAKPKKDENEEGEIDENEAEKDHDDDAEDDPNTYGMGSTYQEDDDEFENLNTMMTAPTLGPKTSIFKLHGSLTQQVRTSTLSAFSKTPQTEHSILICTDVASRGLDLPHISTVVEYDPPFSIEDHLHRVGRTARAGEAGTSVLFLLPGSEENYSKNIASLHISGGLQYKPYESALKQAFGKKGAWDVEATTYHLDVERHQLEDQAAHELATQAFVSHIRAYATHLSSERDIFNVKTLHLGHLAKSFGLRETPKQLGRTGGSGNGAPKKQKVNMKKQLLRAAGMAVKHQSSEFNFM
ncbi:unnamed protein product [Kuraishia capsulata CBS 1993]|uniref:ATP-dependent RNA helicase n=1 Tax=Kuraishia capsulata CBS 1993 TaxID=1382522 RepID=W6MU31_9ASCO|nr:uncharacterized protein KUCA_T00004827001 [Kuraishia capsulata CBS 1993]CDK28842.1 unnamed protein product [Kuraishia capsulata CBS 1993]